MPENNSNGGVRQNEERFRLLVESVRDYAICMLDPEGHVLTWNAGAARFKGYAASEIIGRHFSCFYPPDAVARGLPATELKVATATGSFEDDGWRLRKDGSRFWANVVITALREGDGRLVGFAKVTRDLTQRREHEEALRQSEERFRLLVEGISGYAIFMLDANGVISTWNLSAQRIKGYSAEEAIGRHFSIFYPADVRESGWPAHELQVAAEQGRFVDEGWRVRKDGSTFWANVTISALRDDGGRLVGFSKLTQDLTAHRHAEAAEAAGKEREAALDAERSARIQAQRNMRIKDEFLATLSHELRTPLSAIVGWTQVLMRQPSMSAEEQQRAIRVIDRNAKAQVQLIEELLDLSRVMSGKIRLDLQQLSIVDIVHAAVESAEPMAQAKDVALKVLLDPTRTVVTADGGRLQQVVWNLLTNAIKFTPKGGQVQVLLQRVNSHIELSVSDNGIGIPAHFLPQVFDRFSQRDASTTRAHGGLGLGLAIAKQLVELHGGTIRASSRGEGQGATFFVELPLSIVQIADDAERAHPTVEDPATAEVLALPQLAGLQVLVVDDESDARELLQRLLLAQGAHVTALPSGEAALAHLREHTPDVIVSDVGMPQMDGYQLMRAIRAGDPRNQRVPALALTAFARPEDRKRALLAGYQAHIAKPFDMAELLLLVSGLVRR